jgi:hypothetical protein
MLSLLIGQFIDSPIHFLVHLDVCGQKQHGTLASYPFPNQVDLVARKASQILKGEQAVN